MSDTFVGLFAIFMVFMVPISAVLIYGFREWLAFKERQRALGYSAEDLHAAVEMLQADRAALRQRIETLEAIVTAEDWDAPATLPREDREDALLDPADGGSGPAARRH